jgi:hypothetical protein
MSLTDEQIARKAFEKAAAREGCVDFKPVGDGYTDRRTLRCWRIWQAAESAATAPLLERIAELEREIGELRMSRTLRQDQFERELEAVCKKESVTTKLYKYWKEKWCSPVVFKD